MTPMTATARQYYKGKMYYTGDTINADDSDVADLVATRMALRARAPLGPRPGIAVTPVTASAAVPQPVEKVAITHGNPAPQAAQDGKAEQPAEKAPEIPVFATPSNFSGRNKGSRSR